MTTPTSDARAPSSTADTPEETEPVGERTAPRRSPWVVVGVVILALVIVAASVAIAALVLRNREERRTDDVRGRVVIFDPPLTSEERGLLTHIPFVLGVSGSRVTWQRGVRCARAEPRGQAVASFECELREAGADRVRYTAYRTATAMSAAYDRAREAAGIERHIGACRDGPPAEQNWQSSFSGAVGSVLPDGRVLCLERDGVGSILWTRDDIAVLSETSSSGDWSALHRFWSTLAGPLA